VKPTVDPAAYELIRFIHQKRKPLPKHKRKWLTEYGHRGNKAREVRR
jgi:hypothetical protein